jgi:hypothetical protein
LAMHNLGDRFDCCRERSKSEGSPWSFSEAMTHTEE